MAAVMDFLAAQHCLLVRHLSLFFTSADRTLQPACWLPTRVFL